MKPQSSQPMEITPEIAAKCSGPDQFSKFDSLFRKVIAHPKPAAPPKAEAPRKSRKK
jgi:hypothetical protein